MRAHVTKHKVKYTVAAVAGAMVTALQMFGALAPLICMLAKDANVCIQRADEAAKRAGELKLDEEALP